MSSGGRWELRANGDGDGDGDDDGWLWVVGCGLWIVGCRNVVDVRN